MILVFFLLKHKIIILFNNKFFPRYNTSRIFSFYATINHHTEILRIVLKMLLNDRIFLYFFMFINIEIEKLHFE